MKAAPEVEQNPSKSDICLVKNGDISVVERKMTPHPVSLWERFRLCEKAKEEEGNGEQ